MGSQELPSGAEEVQFTVRVKEEALGEFFCCLYKDRGGRYSAFSPYLQLEHQNGSCVVFSDAYLDRNVEILILI